MDREIVISLFIAMIFCMALFVPLMLIGVHSVGVAYFLGCGASMLGIFIAAIIVFK